MAPSKVLSFTVKKDPSKAYCSKVAMGLADAALEFDCKIGTVEAKFSYKGTVSTRLGNRPITPRTKEEYEGMYQHIWRYCILTGNYADMLPLLSPCPPNAPAMKVETVENFVRLEVRACLGANHAGYPSKRIECPSAVLAQDNCGTNVLLRTMW